VVKLEEMKLEVLYEDNHLIAINKLPGVLVQGDETGDEPLSNIVKQYIKDKYGKPGDVYLGVCHRIDRPVSGAVIFARTSKALERMNKMFAEQKINKLYWAIVRNRPEELTGTLIDYLVKDKEKNITKALDGVSKRYPDAKRSELTYELMLSMENFHLLGIRPSTGRSHQIRAQLAKMGSPIRGDLKYGYTDANKNASIHLHCRSMEFIHPVTLVLTKVTADAPKDPVWAKFCASL
jgi:23S rRNA pseudouridine1911/1915/1917 synthase